MACLVARCSQCRHITINAFIACAGLSVRPISRPKPTPPRFALESSFRRSLGLHRPLRSNTVDPESGSLPTDERKLPATVHVTGGLEAEEAGDLYDGLDDSPSQERETSIPWYLQVQPPERESNTLLGRQQLPELPPDPPPLLKPLLEHISTDLGMDDLILFDLRDIDPPPALGANLLMILGTARSEKHLHVSADRFCRWLKTAYKLAPYADGLLGRGELKLKLRRKARRARLLSNVGSSEKANVDDGIRTGWICVNVGSVPDSRNIMVHKDLHDDYVGFGEEIDGAKIVVQMLTQEKRDELDLETLWGKMVKRQERKEARISPDVGHQIAAEVGLLSQDASRSMSNSNVRTVSLSGASSGPYSQVRLFHASSKARSVGQRTTKASGEKYFNDWPGNHVTGDAVAQLSLDTSCVVESDRCADLRRQMNAIRSMPREEARNLLSQTPFWMSLNDAFPLFPNVQESELRLELLCHSYEVGASADKEMIIQLFHCIEATFIDVPEIVYITALKTLLRPRVSQSDLFEAAAALERMSARGHDIATEEIRALMQSAVLKVPKNLGELGFRKDAFQRLKRLMNSLLGQASSEVELESMYACADADRWDEFWDVWRGFARAMRPRSEELYVAMFRCTAYRKHQAEAMRCLRECVPEMTLEEPPVAMNAEIAKAVKACLFVAEPDIARIAAKEDAFGEWASLWRRCNSAIVDKPTKA